MKTFYFIFVFFYEKRRKFINIFILILNLYKIDIHAIIKIFNKFIKQINRDLKIIINGKIENIYIFNIIFFKNILQQTDNEIFFRYNINMKYQIYFYSKFEKNNLFYNIVRKKKYY